MPQAPSASDDRPPSVDRVPTLTEVVELGSAADATPAPAPLLIHALPMAVGDAAGQARALACEVLEELEPRLDLLLEARLREALAPALARAADGLVRDSRETLARTLHELVEEAVARALHRHRGG